MDIVPLIKGIIIGFAVAAPVGPVGILCIQKTLEKGRWAGFVSGFGAATADAIYGAVAVFGVTSISNLLDEHRFALHIVGGALLLYFGFKIFNRKLELPKRNVSGKIEIDLVKDAKNYVSTFFLTMTNPTTIASFAIVFAGFGIANSSVSYIPATLSVLGIFIGSTLWWLFLSEAVGKMREIFGDRILHKINEGTAFIIIALGILSFLSLM
jgi:threonine/homoserine/homoserine lactone efflux protein